MRLQLTLKNYRSFSASDPARFVVESGGVTAFVGPNNAGKSVALRFFYEFRNMFQVLADKEALAQAFTGRERGMPLNDVGDAAEVFHNQSVGDIEVIIDVLDDVAIYDIKRVVIDIDRSLNARLEVFRGPNAEPVRSTMTVDWRGDEASNEHEVLATAAPFQTAMRRFARAMYVGSARNAINVNADTRYFDIDVGTNFVSAFHQWKTGVNRASNSAVLELSDELKQLFGFHELEVNPSIDRKVVHITVDRHPYELDELGSGVAQVLVTLGNVMVYQPTLVLIDEPELSLHPALQIEFVSALRRTAPDGVLMSTHSIGLARAVADNVYSVTKASGVSRMERLTRALAAPILLGEMGYSAMLEMGFRSLLLAEGPTDAAVNRDLLRRLDADHTVMVMSLGGSSLIRAGADGELAELHRVTDKIYAIIDSERSTAEADLDKPRQSFVQACANVGIACHVLERRSLENDISDSALRIVKGPSFSHLGEFESLKGHQNGWSKVENWRLFAAMTQSELECTDLWKFLTRVSEDSSSD